MVRQPILAMLVAWPMLAVCAQEPGPTLADGPLTIGCWRPLRVAAPDYVFPMVTMWWPYQGNGKPGLTQAETRVKGEKATPEKLAMALVEEIRKRPQGQPVWINVHGWFGNYKAGRWDDTNVMCHRLDATESGTPGVWPDKGLQLWKQRHERLLEILKANGIQVDCWPMDQETYYNQWAHNFRDADVFRNMVLDPRWKTRAFPGTGVKGIQLLDPQELEGEEEWKKGTLRVPDSKRAYDAILAVGFFVRAHVMNQVFAEPTLRAYPRCAVSDFGQVPKPVDYASDTPFGEWGTKAAWSRLHSADPSLTCVPMVGNAAAAVFYQSPRTAAKYPDLTLDQAQLRRFDEMAQLAGGAAKVTPWIMPPAKDRDGNRIWSREQYRNLLVGMARRGVTKFLLWNSGKDHGEPEVEREMVEAFRAAYRAAAERDGVSGEE